MLVLANDWIGLLSGSSEVRCYYTIDRRNLSVCVLNGCMMIPGTGFLCLESI